MVHRLHRTTSNGRKRVQVCYNQCKRVRFLEDAPAAMRRWKDQSGPLHARKKIKVEVITGLKRKAEESRLAAEANVEA